MHRAISIPRWIGYSSLGLSLILLVGVGLMWAQSPMPFGQPVSSNAVVIEMAAGTARSHSMSTRAALKKVENSNSGIVRIEKIADSPNEIMVVAVQPGRTVLTFVDHNDRVEQHEFVVAPAAQPELQPMKDGAVTIYMQVGGKPHTLKSQVWAQDKKAQILNSNQRVIEITVPVKGDPILTAKIPGIARITVQGEKLKEEFEVIVTAPIHELQNIINRLVPASSITVAESGNTLVVSGTVMTADDARLVQQIAQQANAISNIKIGGVQQVQLEVLIAVVNRTEARNMSFSFTQNGTNWFISSLFGGPFTTGSALAAGLAASSAGLTPVPAAANVPFGIINNNNSFVSFLQALRTESLAKILAEPRITTLSGRPAYIVAGGETPLLTSSGQGAPTITYKQFGTVVNFLPVVLGNGKIHLEVRPELSDIDNTLGISIPGVTPTIVPGFRLRSAQVAVQIEDGQTLAIGGLIQNTINASIDRFPVLGDIPGLGVLFTRKAYTETEQELVILVTPRLVDPIDCTKFPRFLPGRETRTPDDFELFMEGILEAPRGPRSVVFHPHMYKPAFHGASNINQIPCADNYYGQPRPTLGTGPAVFNRFPVAGGMSGARMLPSRGSLPMTPNGSGEMYPRPYTQMEMAPPTAVPVLRDAVPSLGGPAAPTTPTLPSSEYDRRPVLPGSPSFPR